MRETRSSSGTEAMRVRSATMASRSSTARRRSDWAISTTEILLNRGGGALGDSVETAERTAVCLVYRLRLKGLVVRTEVLDSAFELGPS